MCTSTTYYSCRSHPTGVLYKMYVINPRPDIWTTQEKVADIKKTLKCPFLVFLQNKKIHLMFSYRT